jgi:carbonic anhydrase
VAGAGKDLLSNQITERDFLLKQIQLSQKLHNIQEVIVLYHDNCGAYGIANADQEHTTEVNDLAKIKSFLGSEFPNLSFQAHIIKGIPVGTLALEKII